MPIQPPQAKKLKNMINVASFAKKNYYILNECNFDISLTINFERKYLFLIMLHDTTF